MDLIPYGAGDTVASWMPYLIMISFTVNAITMALAVIFCLCKCIHFGNREVIVFMGTTCPHGKLFMSRKGRKVHTDPGCQGLYRADDIKGFDFYFEPNARRVRQDTHYKEGARNSRALPVVLVCSVYLYSCIVSAQP